MFENWSEYIGGKKQSKAEIGAHEHASHKTPANEEYDLKARGEIFGDTEDDDSTEETVTQQ